MILIREENGDPFVVKKNIVIQNTDTPNHEIGIFGNKVIIAKVDGAQRTVISEIELK